eukprot:275137-Prorocentrum_minimum.AAC.1
MAAGVHDRALARGFAATAAALDTELAAAADAATAALRCPEAGSRSHPSGRCVEVSRVFRRAEPSEPPARARGRGDDSEPGARAALRRGAAGAVPGGGCKLRDALRPCAGAGLAAPQAIAGGDPPRPVGDKTYRCSNTAHTAAGLCLNLDRGNFRVSVAEAYSLW